MKHSFVNLTPHPVMFLPGGESLPSQGVARVSESVGASDPIGGIPVSSVSYGSLEGIPDPVPGVHLIVSRVAAAAAAALTDREDIFFPFGEVRDESGRIIGVTGLGQF